MKSASSSMLTILLMAGLLIAQESRPGPAGDASGISTPQAKRLPAKPSVGGTSKELSALLDQLAAGDSFSGAVLIAKDGRPIFKKAYGLANKSANSPNTIETKFNLGSVNKSFTAVAIAQLAERGKLSFTDPIGKYLPDYPNKAVADKVTIHQLLTHTSGMGDYLNERFSAAQAGFERVTDYLPVFANDPLAFEPGQGWQYSNAGFIVLGAIVERLTGQSYYEYVKKHIFKPAGMTHTGFYPPAGEVPDSAIPYTNFGPNGPEPGPRHAAQRDELRGGPAGGGYSTVGDMLKFSTALRGNKLLSQHYLNILTTGKVKAGFGKYAYGFGEVIINGVRSFGHNGGGPGIGAQFDIYPDLGYTVVVLTNYDAPGMIKVLSKIWTLLK